MCPTNCGGDGEDNARLLEALRMAEEADRHRAKVKAMMVRTIASVGPVRPLSVEFIQVRMIPEPAEVQLAEVAEARGEPPVPHKRPRNEVGTTFLHQFPNRRARRAKK
jgi:hypothetical protein